MPKLDALGLAGLVLVIVGIIWQLLVAWRQGGLDRPRAQAQSDNPILRALDFLIKLVRDNIGNPQGIGWAFIGIGGYALVLFAYRLGIDPYLTLAIGAVLAALFAWPMSRLLFRLPLPLWRRRKRSNLRKKSTARHCIQRSSSSDLSLRNRRKPWRCPP